MVLLVGQGHDFRHTLLLRPILIIWAAKGIDEFGEWAKGTASALVSRCERLAIAVLRETDVQGATRILRISWDEAWEIKRRAVARGRARRRPHGPARLGRG